MGTAAGALAEAGVQVLHAAGRGKTVDVMSPVDAGPGGSRPPYVVVEYLERMDLAFAAADAVVCRSGAGTVCEISALGLPAVYVPLPVGNGEQRRNAQPVVDAGGGLLVEDSTCTPDWVASTLVPLLGDPGRLAEMGRAAAAFGIRDGDERLADLVQVAAAAGSSR
jgi:UDP-N-acetylglucosamine--N-acetylmuramyl-(pentapeptide) pyrophosphoryl-undecaprenol N-acetylglucosamine transferase